MNRHPVARMSRFIVASLRNSRTVARDSRLVSSHSGCPFARPRLVQRSSGDAPGGEPAEFRSGSASPSIHLLWPDASRRPSVGGLYLLAGLFASVLAFAGTASAASEADAALAAFEAGRRDDAAAMWRERAETNSDPEALYRLGMLARDGHAPSGGIELAAVWFRRAANQGHAGAAYELGRMYWEGVGVVQGKSLAKSYWRDAAELDLPEAQYELALAYRETDRTPASELKARFWVRRAAEQGFPAAVAELQGAKPPAAAVVDDSVPVVAEEPVAEEPVAEAEEHAGSAAPAGVDEQPPIEEAASMTPAEADAPEVGGPSVEPESTSAADVAPAPATETPPAESPPADVAGGLTLYAYRSETGPPIMTVASAQELERVSTDGEWVRVAVAGGLLGWVSAEYLEISGNEARAITNVRVRVLPGLTEEAVPMDSGLKAGDRVQVVEVTDGWAHVRLPDRFTAWIRASALDDS